jgi:hypothetical protein
MDAKSRFGERPPQLRRRPVIGGKSWNHQRGNAVMRTARAPVAEPAPEAAGERADLLEPLGGAGSAILAQRNSPPISS